ncbi:hypothetical protein ACFE04_017257 [Oxalis oulophora]
MGSSFTEDELVELLLNAGGMLVIYMSPHIDHHFLHRVLNNTRYSYDRKLLDWEFLLQLLGKIFPIEPHKIESILSVVEQLPSEKIAYALFPSMTSLSSDQLLNHPDNNVKVAVAACHTELTRIGAPERLYHDGIMKKVFELIVSSLKDLPDRSSPLYEQRIRILEVLATSRSCVIMQDQDLDYLIIEMIQDFFNSIREDDPEHVFRSMEMIMCDVLEEEDYVSIELLLPLLATMKKNDELVAPAALTLAETVITKCLASIKPCLVEAAKANKISLDDYNEVVVSLCQESGSDHDVVVTDSDDEA